MYFFKVKFRLAKDKKAEKIILDEHHDNFIASMEFFNANGKKARVYKKILKQKVSSSYVEIIFEAEKRIENPTMAFRGYSKYLLDSSDLFRNCVTASGNFLKGIESKELSETEVFNNKLQDGDRTQPNRIDAVTDLELVKAVVDLCFANHIENSEERKQRHCVIAKMKNLLKEVQA